MSAEAQLRIAARAYANVYRARGYLVPQPCVVCQADKVEMHHVDYARPLLVIWACKPCHKWLHKLEGAPIGASSLTHIPTIEEMQTISQRRQWSQIEKAYEDPNVAK